MKHTINPLWCKGIFFIFATTFCFVVVIPSVWSFQQRTNYSFVYTDIPKISAERYFVLDMTWDTVLAEKKQFEQTPIASLTKLMTALLSLESIQTEKFDLEKRYFVNTTWFQNLPSDASRMGLKSGDRPSGLDLLKGLLIASGSDAAITLAHIVSGSVPKFVNSMNMRAKQLKMIQTSFAGVTGLSSNSKSSAEDLAILVQTLLQYKYFDITSISSQKSFKWNNLVKKNTNLLLSTHPRVNGIKTGFIEEAGFNLIVTADYEDRDILIIVLNIPATSLAEGVVKRAKEAELLLDYALTSFVVIPLEYTLSGVKVWGGTADITNLKTPTKSVLLHKNWKRALQTYYSLTETLWAPIDMKMAVGTVSYEVSIAPQSNTEKVQNIVITRLPLQTTENLESGGFFTNLIDKIRYFFYKKVPTQKIRVNTTF